MNLRCYLKLWVVHYRLGNKNMSLSLQEAQNLITALKEKEISLGRAPETWYTYENHVYGVAKVAKTIASHIESMDADEVYVSALLHDISRTEEDKEQRFHGILGYEKLIDKDETAARSAILHMFPWGKISSFEKCSKMFFEKREDYDFVADFINNTKLNDVDLLIQLSDSLANKDGIVTLERRAKEYSERHGVEIPQSVIQPRQELKTYFDRKLGLNIYNLFSKQPLQTRER